MEQKGNGWVIALVIITAVVVGDGVYWWQQSKVQKELFGVTIDTTEITTADKKEPKEPLSYSTSGVPVSVYKEIAPFDYTAEITTADKKELFQLQQLGLPLGFRSKAVWWENYLISNYANNYEKNKKLAS